jgi:HlyD family secretion protein
MPVTKTSPRVLTLPLLAALCACSTADAGRTTRQARVVRSDVEDTFLLTGELRALSSDVISCPRIEGGGEAQIRWLAEDGEEVAAGDAIVEFDSSQATRELEERRIRVQQAVVERETREQAVAVEVARRQASLEKAEIEVKKARLDAAVPPEVRSVLENRRVQATLMERESALEKAKLDLDTYRTSSRADVLVQKLAEEKAVRSLDAAERSIASARVTAPRQGILMVNRHFRWDLDRTFQVGDNVWPGIPVATLPDLREMEVAATLSQVDHGRIAAGMAARVVIDTFPGRVFAGRIEEVGAVAPEVRDRAGFPVRIALEKTDPAVMRPGLSVRVEAIRTKWPAALTVPRGAVTFEREEAFVEGSGLAGRRKVKLLGCTPVVCAIGSGLEEGDHVGLD